MTGINKMLRLIYNRGGGYINSVDKSVDILSYIPINRCGIAVYFKNSSQASGVGENKGLTVLNNVLATRVNGRQLHQLIYGVRIDEKMFLVRGYNVNRLININNRNQQLIDYTFTLEEVLKEGTRDKRKRQ